MTCHVVTWSSQHRAATFRQEHHREAGRPLTTELPTREAGRGSVLRFRWFFFGEVKIPGVFGGVEKMCVS